MQKLEGEHAMDLYFITLGLSLTVIKLCCPPHIKLCK